jgi:hypothetical protein
MAVPEVETKIRKAFAEHRREAPLASVEVVARRLGESVQWVAEFEAQDGRIAVLAVAKVDGREQFHRFNLEFAAERSGVPQVETEIRAAFAGYRRDNPLASVEAVTRQLEDSSRWAAEFEARGGQIAVVVAATVDGRRKLHHFTLEFAAPDPAGPGPAAREVADRREREDLLIRGLADALELGHSIKTAREKLRERAGPDSVLYDAIDLGARTFRELIGLHTRANRNLLAALRRLSPTSRTPAAVRKVELRSDGPHLHGELELENRRHREIHVEVPAGVYLSGPDGRQPRWVDLRPEPRALTLLRNERRKVRLTVEAADVKELPPGDHRGELVLGTGDGDFAPVQITLVRP